MSLVLWARSSHTHFWPPLPPIYFKQLLISINLYQHAKNQAFSSLCFGDQVDLKILLSDWPRVFWSISQEPGFPKIWDLWNNTASNINSLYRPKSEKKLWLNFPINPKNLTFGPFFWRRYYFKKIQLSCTTPHEPLTPCCILNKSISRKLLGERIDRP